MTNEKEKKVKEVRVLDLTPEQAARNRKISIIGSIILGLLVIALFSSLLIVYLKNKPNNNVKTNVLSDSLTITSTIFDEFKNKKPYDQLSLDDKIKNLTINDKPNQIYLLLHDNLLNKEIIAQYKQLTFTDNVLFLTLNMETDAKAQKDFETELKAFYKAYYEKDADTKYFDGKKQILIKIDIINYELINEGFLFETEQIKSELANFIK